MLKPQPLTAVQSQRLRAYVAASDSSAPEFAESPNVPELVAHPSVTAALLDALDVVPANLLHAGATLRDLGELGYGARHLAQTPAMCSQLVSKFGTTAVAVAILKTPQDAVDIASSRLAVKTLELSTKTLLVSCQGDQASAIEVVRRLMTQDAEERGALALRNPANLSSLDQLKDKLRVGVLHGVGVETLARLGLDGAKLFIHFGISIHELADALGVDAKDLAPLGVFQR